LTFRVFEYFICFELVDFIVVLFVGLFFE